MVGETWLSAKARSAAPSVGAAMLVSQLLLTAHKTCATAAAIRARNRLAASTVRRVSGRISRATLRQVEARGVSNQQGTSSHEVRDRQHHQVHPLLGGQEGPTPQGP